MFIFFHQFDIDRLCSNLSMNYDSNENKYSFSYQGHHFTEQTSSFGLRFLVNTSDLDSTQKLLFARNIVDELAKNNDCYVEAEVFDHESFSYARKGADLIKDSIKELKQVDEKKKNDFMQEDFKE